MLIRTRHYSIVGAPWTGIRGIGRATLECAPPDWEAMVLPVYEPEDLERSRSRGPLFGLVCHPALWYQDYWNHRHQPVGRALVGGKVPPEDDVRAFCAGSGRGLFTGVLGAFMHQAPEAIAPIRIEHFNPDMYRLTRGTCKLPSRIMPTFRAVQDAMEARPVPEDLAELALAGDPLLRAAGYT